MSETSLLQGLHPRSQYDKRSELELCLRDAFAAGCEAVSTRSLFTAAEYAKREAPIVAERLKKAAQKEKRRAARKAKGATNE